MAKVGLSRRLVTAKLEAKTEASKAKTETNPTDFLQGFILARFAVSVIQVLSDLVMLGPFVEPGQHFLRLQRNVSLFVIFTRETDHVIE